MKKSVINVILAVLLFCNSALAAPVDNLVGVGFESNKAQVLIKVFGTAIGQTLLPNTDNTFDVGSSTFGFRTGYFDTSVITPLLVSPGTADLTVKVDDDAQRLHVIGASSDTALTYKFGDSGTTAAQTLTLSASTADADDDSILYLAGGGTAAESRGSYILVSGNEASTGGGVNIYGGTTGSSHLSYVLGNASAVNRWFNASTAIMWTMDNSGVLTSNAANGGGIVLAKTGTTLALDSGTAATTCSGKLTANGATPVVTSTTCALTDSRIFLSKQSASTAVNGSCTVTAISNGVSFTVACLATDTGTYNFWITQEG